jgi:hypothetical protein
VLSPTSLDVASPSKQKDRSTMIRNLTWGGLVVIALITLLR